METNNDTKIILKTLTYRLFLFVIMTIITYLWFGNFTNSILFSIIAFIIGTSWYWIHEQLWNDNK